MSQYQCIRIFVSVYSIALIAQIFQYFIYLFVNNGSCVFGGCTIRVP